MHPYQLAAIVAAAVQLALQAHAQVQQPPAASPGLFARAPDLANQNQQLDYSTTATCKIFNNATSALPNEFNHHMPNICILLDELGTRAGIFGWQDVLNIQVPQPSGSSTRGYSLLTSHGQVMLEQVWDYAATYLTKSTRQAQNNYQLYVCLTNSINAETKKVLANEQDKYHILAEGGA